MPESKYFQDIIANRALKGFIYNEEGKIVPNLAIDGDDSRAIESALTDCYGSDIERHINEIYNLNGGLTSIEYQKLCVADISPGSLVNLSLSTGQKIELLYLGDLSCCVCHDDCHTLQLFDTLLCLTLELQLGCNAFFRVIRDDAPYPDSEKLLQLPCLSRISVSNSRIIGKQPASIDKPIKTYHTVYSNKIKSVPARFGLEDLTLSDNATFIIDFDNLEFTINENWLNHNDQQQLGQIKEACDIEQSSNGVIEIERGSFYVSNDYKSLILSKKAKLKV